MTPADDDSAPWLDEDVVPTLVEDASGLRPFMAGYLVHALKLRGVPFAAAYAAATEIRRRIAGRARVSTQELSEAVVEILGDGALRDDSAADRGIRIIGPGDGLPFSKGVLSQSLLATAIDPSDAFAVAREIEHELIASGVREISRHDLRELACRVLRLRSGDETAGRYLLWRRHQEPERPVVLLLGGSSGVGKSALALEAARRLGIGRVQSTDSIRQMMRILLSQELVPAIYGSSYDAYALLPKQDGRLPSVIEGFRAQASVVSIGIRASLDRTISESANLIIDGVSLVPGMLDLSVYRERANVVFLVIATLDEDALRNRFLSRATGQKQRLPHRYVENLDGILAIQRHLLESAERYRIPVIDNVSFDVSVRLVIDQVMEALRGRESARTPHAV